jgi:iron(III) transport system substrate-binding protein
MAFLYLVPTGLTDPEEPTWGSWAGRYSRNREFPGKRYFWALTADAQKLGAEAGQFQFPSNMEAPIPEQAPKMADVKLIDYDFAKYGSSDERKRLLLKWDAEIGAN